MSTRATIIWKEKDGVDTYYYSSHDSFPEDMVSLIKEESFGELYKEQSVPTSCMIQYFITVSIIGQDHKSSDFIPLYMFKDKKGIWRGIEIYEQLFPSFLKKDINGKEQKVNLIFS